MDAYVHDSRIHIKVSDDGPGIPASYHSRVFGLFETLRPRDEVEGSGLGLSIILKGLERYEGTIKLDSNPDKRRGSSFQFDLPERSKSTPILKAVA